MFLPLSRTAGDLQKVGKAAGCLFPGQGPLPHFLRVLFSPFCGSWPCGSPRGFSRSVASFPPLSSPLLFPGSIRPLSFLPLALNPSSFPGFVFLLDLPSFLFFSFSFLTCFFPFGLRYTGFYFPNQGFNPCPPRCATSLTHV